MSRLIVQFDDGSASVFPFDNAILVDFAIDLTGRYEHYSVESVLTTGFDGYEED